MPVELNGGFYMVEMFKKFINVITNAQYILIKEKLNTYMKKEVEYIRRLDFSVESSDRYYIMMYKCMKDVLVLVKEREINGCVVRKQTVITAEEFSAIIHNDYTLVKESENDVLREMAWGMEIDGIRVLGIREYVEESYRSEDTEEIYSFIRSEIKYTDIPDNFLKEKLSYPDVESEDMNRTDRNIEFEYLKRVNVPFAIQQTC